MSTLLDRHLARWAFIQEKAIAYRNSKGFAQITWDVLPVRLGCVSEEIFEVEAALVGLNDAHTDEVLATRWTWVSEELSDVALYILSIQHDLKFPAGTPRMNVHTKLSRLASPSEHTVQLRRYWAQAFRAWLKNEPTDLRISLEMLLTHVKVLFDLVQPKHVDSVSLFTACERKLEVMATRPALHGRSDPRT
jgi:hypothetical protein